MKYIYALLIIFLSTFSSFSQHNEYSFSNDYSNPNSQNNNSNTPDHQNLMRLKNDFMSIDNDIQSAILNSNIYYKENPSSNKIAGWVVGGICGIVAGYLACKIIEKDEKNLIGYVAVGFALGGVIGGIYDN